VDRVDGLVRGGFALPRKEEWGEGEGGQGGHKPHHPVWLRTRRERGKAGTRQDGRPAQCQLWYGVRERVWFVSLGLWFKEEVGEDGEGEGRRGG